MSRVIVILIALFLGVLLLLLLGGWIYSMLERYGAFGENPRNKRLGAVAFIFLPVLFGLALFSGVLYVAGQGSPGGSLVLPGLGAPAQGDLPPGGKIVYVCQVFGDMERDQICVINPDGTGQRRVTQDDNGDYNFPSLSPDGKNIIFTGRTPDGYELFEMDLSGNQRQITRGMADASGPEISPDGRSIVFAQQAGGHQVIWITNRQGGNARMVFGPPDGNGWDPVWSPDGQEILFSSDHTGGVQLFRLRADGSDLRQVSKLNGIRGRNDWSPDGKTAATYAGPSWQHEIYLVNLDGSDPRQVTQGGNNLAPSFSPDGRWIAFTSYRDRYQDDNGCEIYIMRIDGSQVTRLTDNDFCDWQPRWGK